MTNPDIGHFDLEGGLQTLIYWSSGKISRLVVHANLSYFSVQKQLKNNWSIFWLPVHLACKMRFFENVKFNWFYKIGKMWVTG